MQSCQFFHHCTCQKKPDFSEKSGFSGYMETSDTCKTNCVTPTLFYPVKSNALFQLKLLVYFTAVPECRITLTLIRPAILDEMKH